MKLARLDNLARQDNLFQGGEPDDHYAMRQVIVVEDDYDFNGNSATDLTKTSTANQKKEAIVNWHEYGLGLIGSCTNFHDWKTLRDSIKAIVIAAAGSDLSNYNTALDAQHRQIAACYMPTYIVNKLGFLQLITDAGGVAEAQECINLYLDESEKARTLRYGQLVTYAYEKLGKVHGLQAEDEVISVQLDKKYRKRGVLTITEDSVDGLEDWLDSVNSFPNGLKKKLQDAVYTIKDATSIVDFITNCVGIIRDGKYPVS